MQQPLQQCQLLTISAVWRDQGGLHAQYQCRTVATIAYSAGAVATIYQQARRKLRYGGETMNAVGVVRFTSCLRSGCSWCSLADSALFSRWAEAVEPLGPKFGSERRHVGSIAYSTLSMEESSGTWRFLAQCQQQSGNRPQNSGPSLAASRTSWATRLT